MPAPTAVILDCDGVLFDSWRANVGYYDAIRAALALPPMDPGWRERVHVMAASQVLEAMFGDDPAHLAAAREAARGVSYEPFYALMDPVPALHDVLATLAARHRLAMATNRSSTVPHLVARFGLDRWLATAVGCSDVVRPKPAPDMVLLAAERLGVAPADAVYVGDAESDRLAAAAAGTAFVAVGPQPRDAARRIGALRELPALLAAWDDG